MALARALAVEPRVLLLDEPSGALDAQVRWELRRWFRRIHDRIGLTSVFVTHDKEEALEVPDRVAIFHEGWVEQVGTPEEVYERPATPFVCGFLGQVNPFHSRVQGGRVRIGAAEVEVPTPISFDGTPVVAYARPPRSRSPSKGATVPTWLESSGLSSPSAPSCAWRSTGPTGANPSP